MAIQTDLRITGRSNSLTPYIEAHKASFSGFARALITSTNGAELGSIAQLGNELQEKIDNHIQFRDETLTGRVIAFIENLFASVFGYKTPLEQAQALIKKCNDVTTISSTDSKHPEMSDKSNMNLPAWCSNFGLSAFNRKHVAAWKSKAEDTGRVQRIDIFKSDDKSLYFLYTPGGLCFLVHKDPSYIPASAPGDTSKTEINEHNCRILKFGFVSDTKMTYKDVKDHIEQWDSKKASSERSDCCDGAHEDDDRRNEPHLGAAQFYSMRQLNAIDLNSAE